MQWSSQRLRGPQVQKKTQAYIDFFELPFFEPKNQCFFLKWFMIPWFCFLKVSCVTSGLLMKKSFGKMLKMVSSKKPRTMVAQRRRWNVGGRFLGLHLHHVSLLQWRVNFGIWFGIKPSPFMDSDTLAFVSLCFLYLFSTFKSSLTLILDRRWLRPLGLTWIGVLRVTLFAAGSLRWPGRPTSADVDRALGRADPQARKMRMCSNETDQIRVRV